MSQECNTIFPHIVSAETIFFLSLEIQRSQYIRPKVTIHKCAETIQGRRLVKGGNNSKAETICGSTVCTYMYVLLTLYALVTQPMLQLRPNCMELRSMDYYYQIFCRF